MSIKFIRRMLKDERGATLVWFAVALPMLLAVVALCIDLGYAYFTRGKLQNTSSAASLAGVALVEDLDDPAEITLMKADVLAEVNKYGLTKNQGLGLQGDYLQAADVKVGTWDEAADTFTPDAKPYNAVEVITERVNANGNALGLLVATVLGETDIATRAIATRDGKLFPGPICMLVLAPTAPESLRFNGGIDVDSVACGICVNSSAPDALRGNGAAGVVDVDIIDDDGIGGFIHVVGGVQNNNTTFNPPPELGQEVCTNPYEDPADFDFDDEFANDTCAMDVPVNVNTDPVIINPGVHCGSGGKIKITGNKDIVFKAGIHHFIGDGGTLEFSTGGSGNGASSELPGVTFLLTNTEFKLTGTKDWDLQANPNEGNGFLFFQDPADPTSNVEHSFGGNVDEGWDGIANFGHQDLKIHGVNELNGGGPGACTVIVAENVEMDGGGSGTHVLDSSGCGGTAPPQAPSTLVLRLVE